MSPVLGASFVVLIVYDPCTFMHFFVVFNTLIY